MKVYQIDGVPMNVCGQGLHETNMHYVVSLTKKTAKDDSCIDNVIPINEILVVLRDHQNNNLKNNFENYNKAHWHNSYELL